MDKPGESTTDASEVAFSVSAIATAKLLEDSNDPALPAPRTWDYPHPRPPFPFPVPKPNPRPFRPDDCLPVTPLEELLKELNKPNEDSKVPPPKKDRIAVPEKSADDKAGASGVKSTGDEPAALEPD